MSTAIILGTRPEIIKMSPVIREFERRGMEYFILHTGQHYSYNMDRVFFEQLKLPEAKYNLEAGSGTKEQGNKATVIIQTGFTGSTGCVLPFNPVILSGMKKTADENHPTGNTDDTDQTDLHGLPYLCASASTVAPVDVAHTYGSRHTWRSVFYRK